MKKLLLTLTLAAITIAAQAQVKLHPSEVGTVEAITVTGLKIISGPKGQKRDMERFKALFLPDAQIGGVFYKGDSSLVRISTVAQFADRNGPYYEQNGFYETQLSLQVEQFGNLATAVQAYETRTTPTGKVDARGVNTYQLVFDKGRWWIVSLLFTPETAKQPLPEKYLRQGR